MDQIKIDNNKIEKVNFVSENTINFSLKEIKKKIFNKIETNSHFIGKVKLFRNYLI